MGTTKTAICLQTKAFFHHLYGFELVFYQNFMSNTLPIGLTRLLKKVLNINSVWNFVTLISTKLHVGSLKDRHGGLGCDSWLLHVNAYP